MQANIDQGTPVTRADRLLGLDGLRALAISGVIAYHLGSGFARGGFLGVDTFFTLSGYLITSILLAERRSSGNLHLRDFWIRRARRLLPALVLMIVAVVSFVWVSGLSSEYLGLRWDALSSLFYFANWHYITTQTSYFVLSSHPSPLLHTWSLAIEEQFYIAWPLILTIGFAGYRGRAGDLQTRRKFLLGACLVGAGISAAWMAHLYAGGNSTTRAYYGTDSRAQSILIGAALAFVIESRARRATPAPIASRYLCAGLGVAGFGGTLLAFHLFSGGGSFVFDGGFALCSICAVLMISSVVLAPEGVFSKGLSVPPVRYIGRISYGMYLWHWPVIVFMDHARTGLLGWGLAASRVAATIAISVVSFHLVEEPIRTQRLAHLIRIPRAEIGLLVSGIAIAVAIVLVGTSISTPSSAAAASAGSSPTARTGSGADKVLTYLQHVSQLQNDTRVLLVGDSMAFTLGVGLGDEASRFNVWFADNGIRNCSVSVDGPYLIQNVQTMPAPACTSPDGSPGNWRALWASWVSEFNPDVVVYLSRLDIITQQHGGVFTNVGQPTFDSLLTSRLQQAVGILSAKGAKVVLMTTPYYDSGEQPNGSLWPEDDPSRVNAYNQLLRQVSESDPGTVSVLDLNSVLSPGGKFAQTIHGVTVRAS
ncbi:MAG TPA: acyltransferase family protein, partial [Acidimicrobiales bacterium]|nr:acyltransferase family protein [Acidimicrobiales bacterium]